MQEEAKIFDDAGGEDLLAAQVFKIYCLCTNSHLVSNKFKYTLLKMKYSYIYFSGGNISIFVILLDLHFFITIVVVSGHSWSIISIEKIQIRYQYWYRFYSTIFFSTGTNFFSTRTVFLVPVPVFYYWYRFFLVPVLFF